MVSLSLFSLTIFRIICDTKDVPGNKSAKETLKKCGNEFIEEYLTRHRINLNIRQVN